LSGAIYTQTTDVENEVNGFFSYDRLLMKMDVGTVAQRSHAVIVAGSEIKISPRVRRIPGRWAAFGVSVGSSSCPGRATRP
jgi:hypothetical protein